MRATEEGDRIKPGQPVVIVKGDYAGEIGWYEDGWYYDDGNFGLAQIYLDPARFGDGLVDGLPSNLITLDDDTMMRTVSSEQVPEWIRDLVPDPDDPERS